ncbi:hypothetical protein [Paracraurococcus ruber]|uniref:Uncharacterized protein n=1 Tax=Paracraurococcus ruber TaxID=77675 RepID=A0ABS1CRE0_9PROT|nr:hypothetical protein [Paracraurococcus ruber]MBK1657011.1 hypothetical protein [Paracraurococcus ruber]TDG34293.1 hypothetical protein E2C05_00630 [Paracraurococcus ruber]
MSIVIIGTGPAGRAAASVLPQAVVIARPDATAWHAEPGLVWVEDAAGIRAVPFARLLLAADEPLLLLALDCAFADGRPVVGPSGETSQAGIFAAGVVLGATTAEEAARQGAIAARVLAGLPPEGAIATPPPRPLPEVARLDPLAVAQLLESPPGTERSAAALAQAGLRGGRLTSVVAPARNAGFAALAALAPAVLTPRGAQPDAERL